LESDLLLTNYVDWSGNTKQKSFFMFMHTSTHSSGITYECFKFVGKNFRRSVTDLLRHPMRACRSRQPCKVSSSFLLNFKNFLPLCSKCAYYSFPSSEQENWGSEEIIKQHLVLLF